MTIEVRSPRPAAALRASGWAAALRILPSRPSGDYRGLFFAHPRAACVALASGALMVCAVSVWLVDVPVARYALAKPAYVRHLALLISDLGLSGYMLVGTALVGLGAGLQHRRERRPIIAAFLRLVAERAFFVFVVIAISGILVQLLKHLVGRGRPRYLDAFGPLHFDLFSIKASLASFPSGHATSIFALAVALCLMMPRYRTGLLGVAVAVAASRTLVGSHYVSDIVAGAALGTLVALGVALAFAKRDIAFNRVREALVLKGRGQGRAAILAWVRTAS